MATIPTRVLDIEPHQGSLNESVRLVELWFEADWWARTEPEVGEGGSIADASAGWIARSCSWGQPRVTAGAPQLAGRRHRARWSNLRNESRTLGPLPRV